jgi:hypothetical protein
MYLPSLPYVRSQNSATFYVVDARRVNKKRGKNNRKPIERIENMLRIKKTCY